MNREQARRSLPWKELGLVLGAILLGGGLRTRAAAVPLSEAPLRELAPGVGYTNEVIERGPWSIHVVRVARDLPGVEVISVHAEGAATGLATVTEQVESIPASEGTPLAALNGDFYQRDRFFAGDPRGLQVVNGELLSVPQARGGIAVWMDAQGSPQVGMVEPGLAVTWPDGSSTPAGLNEERALDGLVLYTGAVRGHLRNMGGREWVLTPTNGVPGGMVAAPSTTHGLRVSEVRAPGGGKVPFNGWVLSAGPLWLRRNPAGTNAGVGAFLRVALETRPALGGVRHAIGGGPVLVSGGRPQKVAPARSDSYEFSSMVQRHPRSAFGWDRKHWMLFQVDGRQPGFSVGMTLEELAATMARWGCLEGMNLDGGGSSSIWCAGRTRNSPCEGRERDVANALVVLRRPAGGKVGKGP